MRKGGGHNSKPKNHQSGFNHHGIGHHGIGHHGIGHHSIGHSNLHKHKSHGHSSFGNRRRTGTADLGNNLEHQIDSITTAFPLGPIISDQIYTFGGSQVSILNEFQSFYNRQQQYSLQNEGKRLNQINLTIVGSKTKTSNIGCICATLFFGVCCIFPLCFMCCSWWKKIASPLYEINIETYQNLKKMINLNTQITYLRLTVVDNALNAQKISVLRDIVSNSRLTGFQFHNLAVCTNNFADEADSFLLNASQIKELPISTSIIWGDLIV